MGRLPWGRSRRGEEAGQSGARSHILKALRAARVCSVDKASADGHRKSKTYMM